MSSTSISPEVFERCGFVVSPPLRQFLTRAARIAESRPSAHDVQRYVSWIWNMVTEKLRSGQPVDWMQESPNVPSIVAGATTQASVLAPPGYMQQQQQPQAQASPQWAQDAEKTLRPSCFARTFF